MGSPKPTPNPEWLIRLIKSRFILPSGLLSRNYPPGHRTIFDNFDDIVPFFLYYGEASFLVNQVRLIRRRGESLLSLCAEDGVLYASGIDEWFGGLYALWKATGDREVFLLLEESIQFVLDELVEGNFLSGAYFIESKKRADFYEPWSAGLLETFCEIREAFPFGFERAQGIFRSWLEDDYYERYGIFPYRMYCHPPQRWLQEGILSRLPSPRPHVKAPSSENSQGILGRIRAAVRRGRFMVTSGYYSQLMKSNSTPAFTLLEFFRATGDAFWLSHLENWVGSAVDWFCERAKDHGFTGKVWGEVHPNSPTQKRFAGVTPAFILVDVLCDCAAWVPAFRSKLPVVKRILDYHLEGKAPSGLLPYYDNGDFYHIDSQIDFAISMRRYAELTHDPDYLQGSRVLTEKALSVHITEEGLLTFSGATPKNSIDPKYNALALKGMINLETLEDSIYAENLYSLFKDR